MVPLNHSLSERFLLLPGETYSWRLTRLTFTCPTCSANGGRARSVFFLTLANLTRKAGMSGACMFLEFDRHSKKDLVAGLPLTLSSIVPTRKQPKLSTTLIIDHVSLHVLQSIPSKHTIWCKGCQKVFHFQNGPLPTCPLTEILSPKSSFILFPRRHPSTSQLQATSCCTSLERESLPGMPG